MNHIKLLQMYEEAESIANEFIRFAMPGHNSISVEGKYIPKTGIMKIKLVQFCFCLFACSGGAESLVAEKSVCGVCEGGGESAQIRGNLVHFPTSVKKEDAGNRDYGKHQNDNNRFPFDCNPAAFPVTFQVRAEQGCVLSCIPG